MGDILGDRMKLFEKVESSRAGMPGLPLMIRIDGKGFSRWTKGMKYPFDERLQDLRVRTTRTLVSELGAVVGYCQSDEISLALFEEDPTKTLYCGGKIQKIVSHAASIATAAWNSYLEEILPEKKNTPALFDARAWNVPDLGVAADVFLWRELDASKNSVSMAARSVYSHKEITNKNSSELQEMLHQKGINWNNYPVWAKRGTYLGRRPLNRKLTPEELDLLPPKHAARNNPDMVVSRTRILELELPPISKVANRVEVLFRGAEPQKK